MANKKLKGWDRSSKRLSFRRKPSKEELPSILLVCEGKKTEPQYFESFRVPSLRMSIVPAGRIHLSVVEMAVREAKKDPDFDEVWCIFDRDKNPQNKKDVEQFNKALELAENSGFRVAYSNDAFELWYLLHFIYFESQISRADYITKLATYIPGGYEKNDREIYAKLEDRMDDAIKRAKKLLKNSSGIEPANADPTTTVFQLVEKLRKYSRP